MTIGGDAATQVLRNHNGMEVTIAAIGGIVQRLTAPDRNGVYADVVLGFDSADRYAAEHPYFGAIIGRYANRIRAGRFVLEGSVYELPRNDRDNHLHGGLVGFDKVRWQADEISSERGRSVKLHHLSVDGDQGYPGNLDVTVIYTLTNDNNLRIDYRATTDKATPINLTSHSYFNLAGQGNNSIMEHQVQILASAFTPVDAGLIPTGDIQAVHGTAMDFREAKAIGADIDRSDEQLHFADGYDHNWVLDKEPGALGLAARVGEPASGRLMEVYTSEPGVQFYTGNALDGSIVGKDARPYLRRSGFCLETQHFPDSPNQSEFPSSILRPGEVYATTTVYRFSTIQAPDNG